MPEQINKLINQDLILEGIDTLDVDFDTNIDLYIPKPVDLTEPDNEFEKDEEDDDVDDIDNNLDYIPEPESKKPYMFKKNIPRWKWEKAYWTGWLQPITREYVKTKRRENKRGPKSMLSPNFQI